MAKSKNIFFCQECGYESAKWLGQCPACKAWNTFVEEPTIGKGSTASGGIRHQAKASEPVLLSSVHSSDEKRRPTGISEFDRVLGGGIVPGSLVLVGGDPGIGKSTLLLQMSRCLSEQSCRTVYVSGEESLQQIRLRADRLGVFKNDLAMLCETNLDVIQETILKYKPEVVIIDSIQTMYREEVGSAPGSVSQVRESTNALMQVAKGSTIPMFIVGHVTKEGVVAGPRVLEHMVDTVLYFEGDRHAAYRIIRGVKNRYGSTNEIGVFEMRSEGLEQILNPSEFMLEGRPTDASGSVVACLMEGTRPILVEIQALLTRSNFGMPRRTAVGTDYNRVNLLMAVLEKRIGIQMGDFDAYVNVAGGMKISEPALDLALVMAMLSSYKNRVIEADTIFFGEVGLAGEIRAVAMTDQRVAEAKKLGFKRCVLPKVSIDSLKDTSGIELIGISNVKEAQDLV